MKRITKALMSVMLMMTVVFTTGCELVQNNKESETNVNNNVVDVPNNVVDVRDNVVDVRECVDLALPSGTLWATCNVGASKPEDYGNYYAWGETSTKDIYNWDTYKYANGSQDRLTKYCNQSDMGNNGFTDNLTTLQSGDDPAIAWGSGWRTPSKEQWDELLNNTLYTWTTQNGVKGRLFTAKNGRTLFLPAAGGCWGKPEFSGDYGMYWSRSLFTGNPDSAWNFSINSEFCCTTGNDRSFGFAVRLVREK